MASLKFRWFSIYSMAVHPSRLPGRSARRCAAQPLLYIQGYGCLIYGLQLQFAGASLATRIVHNCYC